MHYRGKRINLTRDRFDVLRQEIARVKTDGEEVYFVGSVERILDNLGYTITSHTIARALKGKGIKLRDCGLKNLPRFGFDFNTQVYRESDVFNYLRVLDEKGKIDLNKHKIKTFQDVLDKGLVTLVKPFFKFQ